MTAHEYVSFRFSSPHFADMDYEEEQPIRTVEWAAMTDQERADAQMDWLFEGAHIELSDDYEEST